MIKLTSLTILACPKPFAGIVAVTQRNAIESWTRLEPRPQIVLFGDELGVAAICADLRLEHVPNVRRNMRGTPLLDDVIAQGQRLAGDALCGFVNADIVLMEDFVAATKRVAGRKKAFLMIGQRTD